MEPQEPDPVLAKTVLNVELVTCELHRSPFQELEPALYVMTVAAFCMELMNFIVADKEFQQLCEFTTDRIAENLPNPLCCHIFRKAPIQLAEMYEKFGLVIPVVGEIH